MTESSEVELSCKEWLLNELYSELCQMPLWTLSAFGSLKDEDVLKEGDVRLQLIRYLVIKHMDKMPKNLYDNDYRHNWKVKDFFECIKMAVTQSRKILARV